MSTSFGGLLYTWKYGRGLRISLTLISLLLAPTLIFPVLGKDTVMLMMSLTFMLPLTAFAVRNWTRRFQIYSEGIRCRAGDFIALSILLTGLAATLGCNREQASAAPPSIDIPKDEIKTSGDWTYRIIITQPGTRSQGRRGELLYKRAALPVPSINDYVETPWGKI